MKKMLAVLVCCAALSGCTLVDMGVGRGECVSEWHAEGPTGYAELGWSDNTTLLSAELLGGENAGSLVSVDLWRLLHLELGLLGFGVGIGPLQFGGGLGWYHPHHAPTMIDSMCPFDDMCGDDACCGEGDGECCSDDDGAHAH